MKFPAPQHIPIAIETQSVAAVVNPFIDVRFFIMTPAPIKPMPGAILAASLIVSYPVPEGPTYPIAFIDNIVIIQLPTPTRICVLNPALCPCASL